MSEITETRTETVEMVLKGNGEIQIKPQKKKKIIINMTMSC